MDQELSLESAALEPSEPRESPGRGAEATPLSGHCRLFGTWARTAAAAAVVVAAAAEVEEARGAAEATGGASAAVAWGMGTAVAVGTSGGSMRPPLEEDGSWGAARRILLLCMEW